MNKKRTAAVAALILTVIASAFALTACNTKHNPDEAWEILQTALKNSVDAPVYFWQEWWSEEGSAEQKIAPRNGYRDFEMIADRDKNNDLVFENGAPKNLVLKYYSSAGGTSREVYCGGSSGKNGLQQWLFTVDSDERNGVAKTKQPYSPYDYIKTDAFKEFDLDVLLTELIALKREDVDFSIKKAEATTKGHVTSLSFAVTEAFKQRFAEEYPDRESIFKNSYRIFIEITFDRIAAIECYRTQNDVPGLEFLKVDMEYYKLWVVYNGPNIVMPGYDDSSYGLK
jgi:hypothetical protein